MGQQELGSSRPPLRENTDGEGMGQQEQQATAPREEGGKKKVGEKKEGGTKQPIIALAQILGRKGTTELSDTLTLHPPPVARQNIRV